MELFHTCDPEEIPAKDNNHHDSGNYAPRC